MMNLISFSRYYISYLLFNAGGWVYFVYLVYYTSYMTTQNCNSYTKELTDVIKTLVGISLSFTTINVGVATNNLCSFLANEVDALDINHLCCLLITTILLLSVAGICGLSLFGMTSGMTDIQCSNANAEFGLKLSVYGVIWITFLEILLILFEITAFISSVIASAKLHLFCTPCFNMMKKYKERRIGVEHVEHIQHSIPKYSTTHITIPMPVKEERHAVCSVCYDNTITLLLEPCNHVCMCHLCYDSLVSKECPICKTQISATRKIYFASPGI